MEKIYVSYMANDRDYKGVLLINYLLKKHKSKYSYIVICTELVSTNILDILKFNGIELHMINYKYILESFIKDNNEYVNDIIYKWYYGKFIIFSLEKYDKIIYLDTDLFILENIDHLFDYDVENKLYMVYDIQQGILNNKKAIFYIKNRFNSGVIIFKPSMKIFRLLYKRLNDIGHDEFKKLSTDQDILNWIIENNSIECSVLDMKYNVTPVLVTDMKYHKFFEKPIIIHYMLSPKPWDILNPLPKKYGVINDECKYYFDLWLKTYIEMISVSIVCQSSQSGQSGQSSQSSQSSNLFSEHYYGISQNNKIHVIT